MMIKTLFFVLTFTLVLFFNPIQGNAEFDIEEYPVAPDFVLKDVRGNDISLMDLKGKVVFLNFWAMRCPPCRDEIPDFVDFYSQYKDKGLEIIGIHVEPAPLDKLIKFMEDPKYKINYPIVWATRDLMMDYQPGMFIPATIMIDKEGRIRYKKVGPLDKKNLEYYYLEFSK